MNKPVAREYLDAMRVVDTDELATIAWRLLHDNLSLNGGETADLRKLAQGYIDLRIAASPRHDTESAAPLSEARLRTALDKMLPPDGVAELRAERIEKIVLASRAQTEDAPK